MNHSSGEVREICPTLRSVPRNLLGLAAGSCRRALALLPLAFGCSSDVDEVIRNAPTVQASSAARTIATSASPAPPRLVVLYMPCTVNKNYLSPYNPSVGYTPHLEDWSREALVFDRHQTETGLSGIAYASILTGHDALGHGIYFHPHTLSGSLDTAPEAFRDAGYETFYFEKHSMASAKLGYGQGVSPRRILGQRPRAIDFRRLAIQLRSDPDARVFVMTAFSVTHSPYKTETLREFCALYPDECRPYEGETEAETQRLIRLHQREYNLLSYNFPETAARLDLRGEKLARFSTVVERLYKSRVYLLDKMFGELLSELREAGLLEETLIVFTADHGELLERDNALFRWSHGRGLAPEVLAVPLIIAGRQQGVVTGRYPGVTRSIDVFPTMAALAGLKLGKDAAFRGRDLSRAARRDEDPPQQLAFSHTAILSQAQSAAAGAWKQLRALYPDDSIERIWVSLRHQDLVFKYRNMGDGQFGFEAFDLAVDPQERTDIFDPGDAEHRKMGTRLREYKLALTTDYASREDAERGSSKLSIREQTELLRSLGYVE